MSIYTFFKTANILYKESIVQKKYIAKNIIPYLEYLENKHNGSFTAHQKFKILKYYCLYVPSVLCYSNKKLIGQPFTIKDREETTKMGLCTHLYDELFDDIKLCPEQIQILTLDPISFKADMFLTRTIKEIGSNLIETAYDKSSFQNTLKELLEIQNDTSKQFNPDISKQELQRITSTKGMLSFVLFYTYQLGTPTEQTKDVLSIIGGVHQLCNDIFDIYKDCREKNYTLANTCTDFTELKVFFQEQVKMFNQKIMALQYDKKGKLFFKLVMLSVVASTMVAIDYHIKTEKKRGKNINWFEVGREVLVIDMSKPINIMKLFYNLWMLSNIRGEG